MITLAFVWGGELGAFTFLGAAFYLGLLILINIILIIWNRESVKAHKRAKEQKKSDKSINRKLETKSRRLKFIVGLFVYLSVIIGVSVLIWSIRHVVYKFYPFDYFTAQFFPFIILLLIVCPLLAIKVFSKYKAAKTGKIGKKE